MMKNAICLVILFTTIANGQDPTIPSKDIVARLKVDQRLIEPVKAEVPLNFKLRAIVLVDRDHGIAVVEADGRRFRIPLDRPAIATRKDNSESASLVEAVQIRGRNYWVEDFSPKSIALSDGAVTILVH